MKTAMQEAIDKVSFIINLWNDPRNEMYMPDVMELLRDNLKDLLEKEKEQICNSYVEGLEGLYMGAEEYYNQEYGQAGRTFTQDLIPKN